MKDLVLLYTAESIRQLGEQEKESKCGSFPPYVGHLVGLNVYTIHL